MVAFLRRFLRVILVVTGFLLIALFIWYAGPLFEFADYRPLEPASRRLYLILAVVGLWLLWRLIKRLRALKASDNLVAAVLKQAVPTKAPPTAEQIKLRERFEEAALTLKQQRRRGNSLYELPWYVIIGAPGSGKTTALVNSGLKFPLDARGDKKLKGVGGTRNCDWMFADEAVFLDTAGRYTTQDSDATSDAEGWAEFLALLRKYRKRRPINGVILTISAHDLVVQSEMKREEHVEAARRRLLELNRELRIQLPVYLMVTKCDLVAGFTEYFDDLSHEGRAQVWGVTFPYEATRSGDAASRFASEFDALVERLNQRVSARVEEDRDVRRRTHIFAFPQQMAALRDPLSAFVMDVFASSRFDQQVLLRGVYLTSGTQEGTPIDRLLGAMVREFGLSAEAAAPPGGRGKAYFVERLLKEVLIGESGLAGTDTRGEVAKAALHLGAYAAAGLIAALGVTALTVSYGRNQRYLERVRTDLETFNKVPPVLAAAPPDRILTRLNAVRTLNDSANLHRGAVPLAMRWGLYQGGGLGEAAREAYVRELDNVLLPHVTERFKQQVVQQRDPEQLADALKAYLMLSDPKHLNREFLEERADREWGPGNATGAGGGITLATHFKTRLADESPLPQRPLDQAVIEQARATIRKVSISRVVFAEIQRQYSENSTNAVRGVSLEPAAGGAPGLIRRKSGISLAQPLPSLYSKSVFNEVTDTGSSLDLVKRYAGDEWVLGDSGAWVTDPTKLRNEVFQLYEREYIDTWNRVLSDLELMPLRDHNDVTRALEALSGPGSPLRGLVEKVVDNTRFTSTAAAPAPTSTLDTVKKRLEGLTASAQKAAGLTVVGQTITAAFQPYHRLVEGEPGQRPIDRIVAQLAQLHGAWISSPGTEIAKKSADPPVVAAMSAVRQEATTLPPALQPLIGDLSNEVFELARGEEVRTETARSAEERERITARSAEERARIAEIRKIYVQQVLPECNRIVAGRYPFTQGSENNLPLIDFSTLFSPEGIFANFFKTHLTPHADTSNRPWRWQPGPASEILPAEMLRVFQSAADVRDAFFQGKGKTLGFQFTIMLLDFDDSAATRFRLNIEGAELDSQQSRQGYGINWPGPKPGTVRVLFDGRFSTPYSAQYDGPWAWFKLLERSKLTRISDIRNELMVSVSSIQARLAIEALTVHNPFANADWQRFKCGS
jgi:type VI secretion system protein ImpL